MRGNPTHLRQPPACLHSPAPWPPRSGGLGDGCLLLEEFCLLAILPSLSTSRLPVHRQSHRGALQSRPLLGRGPLQASRLEPSERREAAHPHFSHRCWALGTPGRGKEEQEDQGMKPRDDEEVFSLGDTLVATVCCHDTEVSEREGSQGTMRRAGCEDSGDLSQCCVLEHDVSVSDHPSADPPSTEPAPGPFARPGRRFPTTPRTWNRPFSPRGPQDGRVCRCVLNPKRLRSGPASGSCCSFRMPLRSRSN